MSQVNYNAMPDTELRQYFLRHREDKAALQAYLDRLNQHPRTIIADPNDFDFDEKVQAAIRQQLKTAKSNSSQQANDAPLEPTD